MWVPRDNQATRTIQAVPTFALGQVRGRMPRTSQGPDEPTEQAGSAEELSAPIVAHDPLHLPWSSLVVLLEGSHRLVLLARCCY